MTHEETPDERTHEETGHEPRETRDNAGSPGDTTGKPKVLPRDKDPHPKTEDGDAGSSNAGGGTGHHYGERLPGR